MADTIIDVKPVPSQDEVRRPLISIIIPTFNKLDLLQSCLESLVKHTAAKIVEVIVVSNGCTDGTVEYLKTLPPPFRHLAYREPLGFPAAVNAGIEIAAGEFVVLLNNDTAVLANTWLSILMAPFQDPKVGVTGPAKFSWDCGGVNREALAFWCVMIRRKLFTELGTLDEAFGAGMGEDGDFCIRAANAGYRLVGVPEDKVLEFGEGVSNVNFPIYHKGSGTFGGGDYKALQDRNSEILSARWGRQDELESIYEMCKAHPCDVNELFPVLRKYAEECRHITEFGVRGVMTTWAFLAARPKRMISYDIEYNPNIEGAKKEALKAGISFEFRRESTLEAVIEKTDLLFVDTVHTYGHLKAELGRHASSVAKYIAIHDTTSFGDRGEDGGPGEKRAIEEFLAAHPEWSIIQTIQESNGLTVFGRKALSCSIVIPTCGKDWKNVLLKCIGEVCLYTSIHDKEIIVVANGAPPEALDYLSSLQVRVLKYDEPIGYIRAVNAGIKAALAEYVVLLDDDSFLMPQTKDEWLQILAKPFLAREKVGAAGPFGQTYPDLGQVLHSGCTMYLKAALEEVGLFDETFNPGYMGDEDLAIRIRKAGYKIVQVPEGQPPAYVNGVFEIKFPVIHTGTVNTMPKNSTDLPLVKKNRDLLLERHVEKVSLRGPAVDGCPPGHPGPAGVAGIKTPKASIIIPTYQKLEDVLKPTIKSIIEYTDLSDVEVIIVANGCTDGTEEWVKSLGPPFKVISFQDPMGYTRSTNEGIKIANGEFLILYNNDNVLLDQPKNQWMEFLLEPFKNNPKMGITGPLQLHDDYANADVIIGFCLCIPRRVMQECMADTSGQLDEVFSPGGGEDIDLCCKVRAKGYTVRQVPEDGIQGKSHENTGRFMCWHRNNLTFRDIEEYTRFIIKKNGLVNAKRYNKNLKLNLGSGGIEYPGFLSVDRMDHRASIIMDATKLDFDDNSVTEIMASHLYEHLDPWSAVKALKEWFRVLKPGGKLVMEMPDMENLCRKFLEANTGQRYGVLNAIYGAVNTLDDGEDKSSSPHLYGWFPQSIADHLWNAGYREIAFGPEIWPHPEPPNMHVEAIKPW